MAANKKVVPARRASSSGKVSSSDRSPSKGAAASKSAAMPKAAAKGKPSSSTVGGAASAKSGKAVAKREVKAGTSPRKPASIAPPAKRKTAPSVLPAPKPGVARIKDTPRVADGAADRGKWVYCIIQADEPIGFGNIGMGNEPAEVYTVNYRSLAAVVSDTELVRHDPTRENVLAHQGVHDVVMKRHTVIPMVFGTVFKTREDIVELLRSAHDAFRDVLSKMQNKFEFGLKVLWDRDQIVSEIEREDENLRRLKDEIASQKGSTYFARMQYGRLVDATLQQRSEQYVTEIFSSLRDVAVASRTNKPIGDKMILNAAFLVSRDQEQGFDARVKEIGQRHEGKLTFKYTGPWPPYNFVNIRLKLERA